MKIQRLTRKLRVYISLCYVCCYEVSKCELKVIDDYLSLWEAHCCHTLLWPLNTLSPRVAWHLVVIPYMMYHKGHPGNNPWYPVENLW